MEEPRLETGVAYQLHDLDIYNKFQEFQKEGNKIVRKGERIEELIKELIYEILFRAL